MNLKEPLCRTCRHFQKSNVAYTEWHGLKAVKRNGRNYCGSFYVEIEREAMECDKYDDKRNPELEVMSKMAFILEKNNMVGFEKPVFEFSKPKD